MKKALIILSCVFSLSIGLSLATEPVIDYEKADKVISDVSLKIDSIAKSNPEKLKKVETALSSILSDIFAGKSSFKSLKVEDKYVLDGIYKYTYMKNDNMTPKNLGGVSVLRGNVSDRLRAENIKWIFPVNENLFALVISGDIRDAYVGLNIGGKSYNPAMQSYSYGEVSTIDYIEGSKVLIKGITVIIFDLPLGIDEIKGGEVYIGEKDNTLQLKDIPIRKFIDFWDNLAKESLKEREFCSLSNEADKQSMFAVIEQSMGIPRTIDRITCQLIGMGKIEDGMPEWLVRSYLEVTDEYSLEISSGLGSYYCKESSNSKECFWLSDGVVTNKTTMYF